MLNIPPKTLLRLLTFLAGVLICKVTVAVILNYQNYFPPNFESDFLRGRQPHFFGSYQWAFYTHIASGPVSLILGLILVSDQFRRRFPKWHWYLGRIQVACVMILVTPSGLWMAWYAAAGPVAGVGLALLAIGTGTCATFGWRLAVKRRFADHRRWMWRCFLFLCSAVVLRVFGGLATVAGIESPWFDPVATWLSWLLPLTAFELYELAKRRVGGPMALTLRNAHDST